MPINKNVYISPVHSQPEKAREQDERIREAMKDAETRPEILRNLTLELKPHIIKIVEVAFRKYCNAHSADEGLEDLEWQRFKKILNRVL